MPWWGCPGEVIRDRPEIGRFPVRIHIEWGCAGGVARVGGYPGGDALVGTPSWGPKLRVQTLNFHLKPFYFRSQTLKLGSPFFYKGRAEGPGFRAIIILIGSGLCDCHVDLPVQGPTARLPAFAHGPQAPSGRLLRPAPCLKRGRSSV